MGPSSHYTPYLFVSFLQVPGGTMRDSFLVKGVAFKKTFSYAGFEQQPKKFLNPKILLLNIELELKSEKENAEIRYDVPVLFSKHNFFMVVA
jgi:T-complex protein 1 subunit eta